VSEHAHRSGLHRLRRRPTQPAEPERELAYLSRVIDDGRVVDEASTGQPGRFEMRLYPAPSAAQVDELAESWQLHPLLVEDLQLGGQRPKLERYGDVLFLVIRSARYLDAAEDVDFAEFHILVRPDAVAILCQDRQWIDGTDAEGIAAAALSEHRYGPALFESQELLRLGPEAVAYWLLDVIVDAYSPVLRGLEIDKEQVERQVFTGDTAAAVRIYRLGQEVIDLQHTVSGVSGVLDALRGGFGKHGIPSELQTYLQDVSDHLAQASTRVAELRDAFSQILDVNSTLVAQRQNEDMKKISGWAAILFAPTLIAAIYGMNFANMPELSWPLGYPIAVGVMVLFAVVLWLVFRLKKWM